MLYLPYISPISPLYLPYISPNRYVVAMPLWASAVNASQAAAIAQTLRGADMLSEVGLRSTSSEDPRYSNEVMLAPYSNQP